MADTEMDIDPPAQSSAPNAMAALMAGAKGKAKADAEQAALTDKEAKEAEAREGLPWSVEPYSILEEELISRVEKYRPVTLDDVVSHQDITTTSQL